MAFLPFPSWRSASWIAPWPVGLVVIGFAGRYGHGARMYLPEWVDLAVIVAFSLAIFYFAVSITLDSDRVRAAVEEEAIVDLPAGATRS